MTVNRTRLVSGHVLTVTATSNVTCEWAIRWVGQTRLKRNTRVMVARFIAPRVTKTTKYRLLAICNYRAKVVASPRPPRPVRTTGHRAPLTVEAIVPPHWVRTIIITVDPPGIFVKPSGHLLLPDTGGPPGRLLVLAFGLLLTGTGAVRLSRRRVAPN